MGALVRWAVTEAGAATAWEVCFELTAMLEKVGDGPRQEFVHPAGWTTVARGAAGSVVQDLASVLDAGGDESVEMLADIRDLSNATVELQSAISLEGPWFVAKSWNAAATESVRLLTHFGASSSTLPGPEPGSGGGGKQAPCPFWEMPALKPPTPGCWLVKGSGCKLQWKCPKLASVPW